MRRSLVSFSALAFAGLASAQSSVMMFGVVDASISRYSNRSEDRRILANPLLDQGSQTRTLSALASSGYNASKFGFRGTEDLGGGLAASFWLEAPISNDDGQAGIATFARRSTVSLSGGFGEIRLGRDYSSTFWNDTVFDAFVSNGVGTSLILRASTPANAFAPSYVTSTGVSNVTGSNYVRASNTVGYFLPAELGGFYGQVQYSFNEKTHYDAGTFTPAGADTRSGHYGGARFGYANGPLDVAIAYGESILGSDYYAGTTTALDTLNIGASYDFGPAKLLGELSRMQKKVDHSGASLPGAPDSDIYGYLVGVMVPVGPGLVRASYGHVRYDAKNPLPTLTPDPSAQQLALGYVHNLSKRTALYATVAYLRNKNGSSLTLGGPAFATGIFTPKSSTGYDFGIRHAF